MEGLVSTFFSIGGLWRPDQDTPPGSFCLAPEGRLPSGLHIRLPLLSWAAENPPVWETSALPPTSSSVSNFTTHVVGHRLHTLSALAFLWWPGRFRTIVVLTARTRVVGVFAFEQLVPASEWIRNSAQLLFLGAGSRILQAGLKFASCGLHASPASASPVLELQVCTTISGQFHPYCYM